MAVGMLALPACSDDDDDDSGAAATTAGGKTYKLRLAHTYPAEALMGVTPQKFADLVDEYTSGRVEIEIYPSGMLFGVQDLNQAVQTGSIEMIWQPVYYMNNILPFMMIDMLGGFWESYEHCRRFNTHPDVVGRVSTALAENDMHLVGMVPMSFYTVYSTKVNRELKTLKDLNGLEFCSVAGYPASPMEDWAGFTAVGLDATELLTGFQTGMCNIYATSPANVVQLELWEMGAKHAIAQVGAFNGNIALVINPDAWNELPMDLQDIITNEVVPAWQDWAYEALETTEAENLQIIGEKMETLNYVTTAENAAMMDATKDNASYKMLMAMTGEELYNLADSLRPSND